MKFSINAGGFTLTATPGLVDAETAGTRQRDSDRADGSDGPDRHDAADDERLHANGECHRRDPDRSTRRAVFSEPMNPATFTGSTMVLRNAANVVIPATITYESRYRTGVLTPSSPLLAATRYTVTVSGGSAGVKDVAGNALAANYVSSFTTR